MMTTIEIVVTIYLYANAHSPYLKVGNPLVLLNDQCSKNVSGHFPVNIPPFL